MPVTESVPDYMVVGSCNIELPLGPYYVGNDELSLIGVSGQGCVLIYPELETAHARRTKYAQFAFRASLADYTPGFKPEMDPSFVEMQLGVHVGGVVRTYRVKAELQSDYLIDEYGKTLRVPDTGRLKIEFSSDTTDSIIALVPGLPDPAVDTLIELRFDNGYPQVFVNGIVVLVDSDSVVDFTLIDTETLSLMFTSGTAIRAASVNRQITPRAPVECVDETLYLDEFTTEGPVALLEHTPDLGGPYTVPANAGDIEQLYVRGGALTQTTGVAFFNLPIEPNPGRTTVFHIELNSALPLLPFGLGLFLETDNGTEYFNFYNSGDTIWQVGVSNDSGILNTRHVNLPVLLGKHRLSVELASMFNRLVMYVDDIPVYSDQLDSAAQYNTFGIRAALNGASSIDNIVCSYVNECYSWPEPLEPGEPVTPVTANPRTLLVVTCEEIITLYSGLVGNPTGHTFEWEQQTGTPVEWLEDRFQQDVMFRQPGNVRDDKVFRLYIDRGLPYSQEFTVLVTAVPTEFVPVTTTYRDSSGVPTLGGDSITFRGIMPALGGPGVLYTDHDKLMVAFDIPRLYDETRTDRTVSLMSYRNGGFEVEQTLINPSGSTHHINNAPKNTRLKLVYSAKDDAGNLLVNETSEFSQVYPTPSVKEQAYTDGDVFPLANSMSPVTNDTILEVRITELIPMTVTGDVYSSTVQTPPNEATVLQVVTRELALYTAEPEYYNFNGKRDMGSTATILEVRKLDYSSLG